MSVPALERATFETSRLLEFFSVKELLMQIGHSQERWPAVLLKEIIDNGLDACETAGAVPEIEVVVEPDAVSVRDNGPGLPASTLERSLDYLVRVSDKSHYTSPTRGQLGNALKCVWAAPYVVTGREGRVDVVTGGQVHQITVALNRIAQRPELSHTVSPDGLVKTGTLVKMYWPRIASSLAAVPSADSYNARTLLEAYAIFNPHCLFTLRTENDEWRAERSAPGWVKWSPGDPTSPHWYTVDRLRALIAAYLTKERSGERARTVREFVSEFRGLSGTAKQKAVTEAAALSGAYLHDLVDRDDVNLQKVETLLSAMQQESRPVKPEALGIIGEAHFATQMARSYCVDRDSVKYKKVDGMADGLPFVWEVAFGIYRGEYEQCGRTVGVGLNWTPALKPPISQLTALLGEMRVDWHDPVAVVVHLACPRMEFTDRGKGVLELPPAVLRGLESAVKAVANPWKEAKRQTDRRGRVRAQELEQLRKRQRAAELSIKEASYFVMREAYLKASANGRLPANARQVMYAARPLVLNLTGGRCWKKSSYFTQTLLPDYVEEHPDLTADWDVVFDARGHLREPHTRKEMGLGTLEVRRYMQEWTDDFDEDLDGLVVGGEVETIGPRNRYGHALFIEKEGFNQLFEAVQLVDRFDIALMSTKGMSVTAARQLVERLSKDGVEILVIHDFDKAGFSIVNTLRTSSRRYRFGTTPKVVDLGLRLADVEYMQLASEAVDYDGNVDPRINLCNNGATEEECQFLVKGRTYGGGWLGHRVELNAMTSDQLIQWVEDKLVEAGVQKIVPTGEVLEKAYRRAVRRAAIQKAIDKAIDDYVDAEIEVPADLEQNVRKAIVGTPQSWDSALWDIARKLSGELDEAA